MVEDTCKKAVKNEDSKAENNALHVESFFDEQMNTSIKLKTETRSHRKNQEINPQAFRLTEHDKTKDRTIKPKKIVTGSKEPENQLIPIRTKR